MSTISKNYRKNNTLTLQRFDQSMAAPILLGILFFFVLCLGAVDSIKGTVMVVAVFTLFIIAVRFNVLRERVHWPFIALTLVVIMDGISTFYAVSGKFALREFLKVFLAYLMAVILLATSPKKEEVRGKRIATILAVCTGIGSLLSIDLISTRIISGAVTWVLGHFTEIYSDLQGIVAGTRITSFFANSNVFAGFSGLGVLLSLGMAEAAEQKKERCIFLCLLYFNSLAFLLALSMGAIIFLAIAFLIFLLIKSSGNRISLFILMLELLILAAASMAVITKTAFQEWTEPRIIPLLCAIAGAAALCGIDICAGQKLAPHIVLSKKTLIIAVVVLVVIVAAFIYASLTITGDAVLSPGETLMRTAYPKPGTYTLDAQVEDGSLNVRIRSRNQQQSSMNQDSILYNGPAENAQFTVPDDSRVVFFDFSSESGAHLQSAGFDSYKIPLRYKLLPASVAYRLQGVLVSHSVTMRLDYFRDGMKLFRRSPVFGLGIGAFENAIKSVQSYYYETKYAHNHYFQTMLETGVVGLLLFLFLMTSSAIAIWKSRKKQSFAPMLGAIWFFMAGQALHDIVFSAYAYLPLAHGSFILINLCCGEYVQKPKLTKTLKTVSLGVIAACTVIYCGFLAGNMMAKRHVDQNPTLQTLTQSVKLDRFEWADYALPYVINATGDDVSFSVRQQADVYAERLAQVNSNTIPIYLAEYYFQSDRSEQGIEMLEKYVDYVASDQKAWQDSFDLLRAYDDGSETFRSGALRLAEKLETWNADNIGIISLNSDTMNYISSRMQ